MRKMKQNILWITACFFGMLPFQPSGLGQGNPEIALRVAMETETVEGDLNAAIEQYGKIAESSDRTLAAKALIRMAGCYEKLGVSESRKIYERVLRDFADQKEAAAMARSKLNTGDSPVPVKGDRVVWAGEEIFGSGRVSPNGRFLSDVDWNITGALMLYDLVSHTNRPLTEGWDGPGNSMASAFSPDGKQIAYGWQNYEPRRCEIRIVSIAEPGLPEPRLIHKSEDARFLGVTDWSPDGKWLAVRLQRRDNSGQIALFSLQDQSLRVLKTVDWRGPEKIFFSPDGKYLAYDLPASDEESQRELFVIAVDGTQETRIAKHPAQDRVMGWSPDGSQLIFASDRTASMGLWAVPVSDGEQQGAPKLLKPDVGAVYSVGLTASGALYVTRDTSTQSLQVAPIDLKAGKLTGPPVVQAYRSMRPDWSPDGKYLAFRSSGPSREAILTIRSTETGEVRELRPSLNYFNEPQWMPDGQSLVTWGRDFKGRDAVYRIDAETGATSVVTASGICRVQISPDGRKLYYESREPRGKMELDLTTGETRMLFEPPEDAYFDGTLMLSPDGRYFGGSRRGKDNKTSAVVVVPVADGEPRELLRASEPSSFMGSVTWSPDSQSLVVFWTRFGPGPNWSEPEGKELWLVPVDGGKARKLDIDINEWKGGIRLHPNGNQIAFFSGEDSREVWAFENLLPSQTANR